MTPGPEPAALLPHRRPMLLLHEVDAALDGVGLTGRYRIAPDEPWFQTAGPYPPVLLVESWCQAAGALVALSAGTAGRVMLFGGMSDVRLRGAAYPGDTLEHHVRLERAAETGFVFSGTSTVDGSVLVEVGRVVMTMRPPEELGGGRG